MSDKLRYSSLGRGYRVGYNPIADIKSIEDITFNGVSIMDEFSNAMHGIKVYFGNENFEITSTDAMIKGMKNVVIQLNCVESCFHVLDCRTDSYIAQFDEYWYAKQFIDNSKLNEVAYLCRIPRNIPNSLKGIFITIFIAMFRIYKEYEFTKEDLDIIWKYALAASCNSCSEKYDCDSREAFNNENYLIINKFNDRFRDVDENTHFRALNLVSKIVDAKRSLNIRKKEWERISKEMKRYEV